MLLLVRRLEYNEINYWNICQSPETVHIQISLHIYVRLDVSFISYIYVAGALLRVYKILIDAYSCQKCRQKSNFT